MFLVTGFEPFGGLTRNPSAEIAEAVAGDDVEAAILPVDYDAVVPRLDDLLRRDWDGVLLMGIAIGRPQLTLERVAINFRDRLRPDNAGGVPEDPAVVPGGPAAYFSTLPVDRLCEVLRAEGIPAAVSLTAGAYLCNASFYLARHHLEGRSTPCGFLHLPPTEDLACGAEPVPRADQIVAVQLILEELRS
jgi:pyroglutamyl-peptidase